MQSDKSNQQTGDREDMQSEKSRERRTTDDRSAEQQLDQRRTDDRYPAGDRCADPEPPVSILVEPQHLASERHSERHQQQENAENPRQLSRILVSSEQEHLG